MAILTGVLCFDCTLMMNNIKHFFHVFVGMCTSYGDLSATGEEIYEVQIPNYEINLS